MMHIFQCHAELWLASLVISIGMDNDKHFCGIIIAH